MASDRLNNELQRLRRGQIDFDELARELDDEGSEFDEDDGTED
jgi:hypothetical protein